MTSRVRAAPQWMSVLQTDDDNVFVVVSCYDEATWRAKTREGDRSPRRRGKRQREPTPEAMVPSDDQSARDLVAAGTVPEPVPASLHPPTCATDVLSLVAVVLGESAAEETVDAQTHVTAVGSSTRPTNGCRTQLLRSRPSGLSVGAQVPRGMTSRTYCALLDESVRRQAAVSGARDDAMRSASASRAASASSSPPPAPQRLATDDAVLSVRLDCLSVTGGVHRSSRRIELALRATHSDNTILLLSSEMEEADESPDEAPGAIDGLRALWGDLAVHLRKHEAVRALAASQTCELTRLRQALEELAATQVREQEVQPLEALALIVNAKKARIAELVATVESLREEVKVLQGCRESQDRSHGVHASERRTPSRSRQVPSRAAPGHTSPAQRDASSPHPRQASLSSSSTCDSPSEARTDDGEEDALVDTRRHGLTDPTTETRSHATTHNQTAEGASAEKQKWLNDLFAL